MKIPKLNRHDPVEIIWQDAMSNGSGWQYIDWEEYEKWNMTTRSVGIYLGRTKDDGIVFCRNWHNPVSRATPPARCLRSGIRAWPLLKTHGAAEPRGA